MATPSKSMTTSEFAKATGIRTATIAKMIQEGKLKAKKEGNKMDGPLEPARVENCPGARHDLALCRKPSATAAAGQAVQGSCTSQEGAFAPEGASDGIARPMGRSHR
jgi:excisionase family DNA binding protein